MLRRSSLFFCSPAAAKKAHHHVDVCIIGGGPAGIASAIRARDFGKSVCIIERHRVGGRDVWNGTMASKALFEMAKFSSMCRGSTIQRCLSFPFSSSSGDSSTAGNIFSSSATQQEQGENCVPPPPFPSTPSSSSSSSSSSSTRHLMQFPKPDFCVAKETIRKMCETREQQLLHQLKQSNIQLWKGKATFTSPYEVCIYSESGEFQTITADYFVVATGARPRRPAQFKPDGVHIVNSEQILSQPFPNSLLICGGGGVGAEFASIYSNLGTTKVSIIEHDKQILPRTDPDIHNKIKSLFKEKGVILYEGFQLQTLRVEDNVVQYAARNPTTGEEIGGQCEKALMALGRVANYEKIGIDTLAGTVIQNGKITCDRFGRCIPFRHIYVVGDASGGKTVVTAETQGRSVIEHAFSFRPQSGSNFSETHETRLLLADQEFATLGWNELRCKSASVSYRVAQYSFEYVSRALAMNNTKGFVKIIVTNDREQKVLGVSCIGPQASSIVEIASSAVLYRKQVHEFEKLFVAYPAVTQGFQECARALLGHSMIKPGAPGIEIRSWSPNKPRGRAFVGDEEKASPFTIETTFQ